VLARPPRPGAATRTGPSTASVVLLACVAALLARLSALTQPLRADEGGYLLAARAWRSDGEFLYGDVFVDRPPLLMAAFRLAALVEWDGAVRLLAVPAVLGAVLACAWAGHTLAGGTGARWSAVVAAALVSSPALAADQTSSALLAVPWVALSAALVLAAWRRATGTRQAWLAGWAGAAATAAVLTKQSSVEGLVVIAALVGADVLQRRRVTPRSRVVAGAALAGALLPLVAVVAWAGTAGADVGQLWRELGAFRQDALHVILQDNLHAPLQRAAQLAALAVLSAAAPLGLTALRAAVERGWRMAPEEWALLAALLVGVPTLLASGSFWPHYLLTSAGVLPLAAGAAAARRSPAGAAMRRWAVVAAVSSAVMVLVVAVVYATTPRVWWHERTGDWLGAASAPGDSAVVLYGSPSLLERADLPSPYPYLWSLPMRAQDPELERLRALLAGPDAPAWVVQTLAVRSWGFDADGGLRRLLESRYRVVAHPCGNPVRLRTDLSRELPPLPRC